MNALWARLRARLVDDWHEAGRLWSVRLSTLGSILFAAAAAAPDMALGLWNALPVELRSMLPEHTGIALAAILFAATAVTRIIKQKGKTDV